MKLTLQLQLLPTSDQKTDLLATMERFNEAATFAAKVGFEAGVFGQVTIHKLAYHEIRERFGLSSQMAVRAIAKAVECFQRDKMKCPVFKPRSAICYDQRVLSFKGLTTVSLWAMTGRLLIPFVCGDYQKERQGRIKGQADLVYREGKFFLLCTIDMPEGCADRTIDVLGVDLGIVNIATDSNGETFSGRTDGQRREALRQTSGRAEPSRDQECPSSTRPRSARERPTSGGTRTTASPRRSSRRPRQPVPPSPSKISRGYGTGSRLRSLSEIDMPVGRSTTAFVRDLQGDACRDSGLVGGPSQYQPDVLRLRTLREGQPEEPSRIQVPALRSLRERRFQRGPEHPGQGTCQAPNGRDR